MSTIAALAPFVLAGAFLPTWTSRVIIFLGTDRPLRVSLAYISGNASWRLLLGGAVLLSVDVAQPRLPEGVHLTPDVAAILAVTCGVLGLALLLARPHKETSARELPRWVAVYRRIPAWIAFSLGFVSCASPGVQWAYFLGGMGVIVSSGFGFPLQLALTVVFVVLLESMLFLPIGVFLLRPEEASSRLAQVEYWLGRNGAAVTAVILMLVAVLLVLAALGVGPLAA